MLLGRRHARRKAADKGFSLECPLVRITVEYSSDALLLDDAGNLFVYPSPLLYHGEEIVDQGHGAVNLPSAQTLSLVLFPVLGLAGLITVFRLYDNMTVKLDQTSSAMIPGAGLRAVGTDSRIRQGI